MPTAHDELAALERWLTGPRFAGLVRLHDAREVLQRRSTLGYDFSLARDEAETFHARLCRLRGAQRALNAADLQIGDASEPYAEHERLAARVRQAALGGVSAFRVADARVLASTSEQPRQVLLPIAEVIGQLTAARLQLDVLGVPGVLVATTDARQCQLLEASELAPDAAFVLGASNAGVPSFAAVTRQWSHAGSIAPEHDALVARWRREAGAKTFAKAVAGLMNWPLRESHQLPTAPARWLELAKELSFEEMRECAERMGIAPFWDPERARAHSGEQQVEAGLEFAIARALALAPYADVVCLRAQVADLSEARAFAAAVHARFPAKLLGYDAPLDDARAAEARARELGELGFAVQFASVAQRLVA